MNKKPSLFERRKVETYVAKVKSDADISTRPKISIRADLSKENKTAFLLMQILQEIKENKDVCFSGFNGIKKDLKEVNCGLKEINRDLKEVHEDLKEIKETNKEMDSDLKEIKRLLGI